MFAKSAEESPGAKLGAKCAALLARAWTMATARRNERRLRVCEMVSLGDKRFLAVVECDRQRFLLAGTPQSIALLERLREGAEGSDSEARRASDAASGGAS